MDELQKAIESRYACRAFHVSSRTVTVRWANVGESHSRCIHRFQIEGHPDAQLAFAWEALDDGAREPEKLTVVLAQYGIKSEEHALRHVVNSFYRSA